MKERKGPIYEKALEKLTEEVIAIKIDIQDLKKKIDEMASTLNKLSEQPPYVMSTEKSEATYTPIDWTISADETAKLLACLSNPERIKILHELLENEKYFTDLLKSTGITHSPLRFHLKILLNAGYITQERKRGKYLITKKGERALRIVGMITGIVEQPDNLRARSRYLASIHGVNETQPEWLKTVNRINDGWLNFYS